MSTLRHFLPGAIVIASLLSGCANLQSGAGSAAGPDWRPIERHEIENTGAPSLYALIQGVRPDWLWVGGDSADAASARRVLVFSGTRLVGSLDAARGLGTEDLSRVVFGRRESYSMRGLSIPDGDIQGIIQAVRRREWSERPNARVRVSAYVGSGGLDQGRSIVQQMREHGWAGPVLWYQNDVPATHSERPVAEALLSASYRTTPSWGVEAVGLASARGFAGARHPEYGVLTAHYSALGASLLATYTLGQLQIGAGPALQRVESGWKRTPFSAWRFRRPDLGAAPDRMASNVQTGIAGDLTVSTSPASLYALELKVHARYFSPITLARSEFAPEVTFGGLTVVPAIGIGLRF